MITEYILVLTLLVTVTTADFRCLCNYHVELKVYPDTNNGSTDIGSLYEFDCKPTYQTKQVNGWQAIQFEHKVGFVLVDKDTRLQTCPGNSPIDDLGNKYACPFGVLMQIPLQYIIQHGNYCYQLYPYQTKDWMTDRNRSSSRNSQPHLLQVLRPLCPYFSTNSILTESYCQSYNGSLVVISHSDIQTTLMLLLLKLNYRHPVWIGLHDMRTEGTWEWTDGTLLSNSFYENWRPGHANRVYHNEEDCAILDPRTGRWDEVVCKGFLLDQQRHPWICQYKISSLD